MTTPPDMVLLAPERGKHLAAVGEKIYKLLMESTQGPGEAVAVLIYTKNFIEKEFDVKVQLIPFAPPSPDGRES